MSRRYQETGIPTISSRNLPAVVKTSSNAALSFQPHIRMLSDGKLMGPMYHRTNRIIVPKKMSESTNSLVYTSHANKAHIKKLFRIDDETDNSTGIFHFILSMLQAIANRKAVHAECLPAEILE